MNPSQRTHEIDELNAKLEQVLAPLSAEQLQTVLKTIDVYAQISETSHQDAPLIMSLLARIRFKEWVHQSCSDLEKQH